MSRNIKLTLAYDGADFNGWQVQPGLPTIQGILAEAIARVTHQQVLPQGCGRTDAGVHALAQVATFPLRSPIPEANLVTALNHILPSSIRVLSAEEAAENFDARRSAVAKKYIYRIYRRDICPPFLARYVWHYPYPLDERAMIEAAGLIIGIHDFTSFAAVDREADEKDQPSSNIREIFASTWRREGDELIYEVRGNGFLHHMVRNLVGTFLLIGKETLPPSGIKDILEKKSRAAAGATAAANGLYLAEVQYP